MTKRCRGFVIGSFGISVILVSSFVIPAPMLRESDSTSTPIRVPPDPHRLTHPQQAGHEHSPEAPLSIHDMTVAYHRKPVLWDVDLDVPEGKLIGIVGPNGAGKSTLIKACLDLVPRASGRVDRKSTRLNSSHLVIS